MKTEPQIFQHKNNIFFNSSKAVETHSIAGIAYSTVDRLHINEIILRRFLQILPQVLSKKVLRLAKPRKPIKHLLLAGIGNAAEEAGSYTQ